MFLKSSIAEKIFNIFVVPSLFLDTISMESYHLNNIKTRSSFAMKKFLIFIVLVVLVLAGAYFYLIQNVQGKVDEFVVNLEKSMGENNAIKYSDVSVDPFKQSGTVKNITINMKDGSNGTIDEIEYFAKTENVTLKKITYKDVKDSITIDTINVKNSMKRDDIYQRKEIEIKNVKYDIPQKDKEAAKKAGIDKIEFDINSVMRFDIAGKIFEYESVELRAKNLFNIVASFKAGNMDPNLLKEMSKLNLNFKSKSDVMNKYGSSMQNMDIRNIAFSYSDNSFIEKSFKSQSIKTGKSVDELRKEALEDIEKDMKKPKNKMMIPFMKAAKELISGKAKNLTVTVAPNPPAKIQEIFMMIFMGGKPEQVMDRLNMKIVTQ